ncbi:recombinase family protein [Actinoplanes sp. NPDC051343]|uniref:recombinase family protein n=1 Tax=Actinoplanes sp. NPDC051343 TaxID=3363906 RepID=UPI00378AC109
MRAGAGVVGRVRRSCQSRRSRPPSSTRTARAAVRAGSASHSTPHHRGDERAGPAAGSAFGWAAAVRVSAGRRGPAPQRATRALGSAAAAARPGRGNAPHVRWIFAQRLAGNSTAGIARTLNALGVLSPAAHDPDRNRHRQRSTWTVRTVAAILANPRYTGRQVWKRQSIDHHERRPGDKSSRPVGCKPTRGWNPRDQWVISPPGVHPALVSEDAFLRAQQVSALSVPDDANPDRYQLTGLVICGLCGRRAEGHWAHGRARYRCRHGRTSASDALPDPPKTLFVRQDQLIEQATIQLAHMLGVDAAAISVRELARQLRERGITIVCTPVSITLDVPTAEPEPPSVEDPSGQLQLSIAIPRRTTKNPHQNHPANVNDLGGG